MAIVISNPSTTPRGIMLTKGVVLLMPGEVKKIPEAIEEEIRELFKNDVIMQIVDAGLLRFSELDKGEELQEQETPTPPGTLATTLQVGDTGLQVSVAEPMRSVGTMEIY